MWAARVVVWGFDLGADEGFDVLAEHYNPRCQPPWSEPELRRKCDQATDPAFKHPRGWLLHTERDRPAPRDPNRPVPQFDVWGTSPPAVAQAAATLDAIADAMTHAVLDIIEPAAPSPARPAPVSIGAELAEPVAPPAAAGQGEGDSLDLDGIDPADPFRLAQGFLLARHWLPRADAPQTLRHWGGRYYEWKNGAYDQLKEGTRSPLAEWTEAEFRRLHVAALARAKKDAEKGAPEGKPPAKLKVTRGIVADAQQALDALCRLPDDLTPPGWIGAGPSPAELVACRNGLVHVPSHLAGRPGAFVPGTPRFVSCVRTEFDFNPDAPAPAEWLKFLDTIWADDPDSIACLQEWFGYLLTPDTSLHKMLMIVGPPRAGKGTIGRVLTALVGARNVASPSVGKLGDRFALSDLLDKSVGLFADARLSGRADAVQITEELLGISGEDARTVDVKFRDPVTTTLRTRFVFLTNELPRFGDSSGAIVSRFVFLKLTKTFADNPDLDLLDRLLPELPGILIWSLQGWKRLKRQRAFTIPNSSTELREDADALASPVKVWAEECCELQPDEWTATADLYQSYKVWSERRGRDRIGAQEHFVRDMLAALPMLTKLRKREGTSRAHGYNGIRVLSAYEAGEIPV
jgi:putative DNA primase/helicase